MADQHSLAISGQRLLRDAGETDQYAICHEFRAECSWRCAIKRRNSLRFDALSGYGCVNALYRQEQAADEDRLAMK